MHKPQNTSEDLELARAAIKIAKYLTENNKTIFQVIIEGEGAFCLELFSAKIAEDKQTINESLHNKE